MIWLLLFHASTSSNSLIDSSFTVAPTLLAYFIHSFGNSIGFFFTCATEIMPNYLKKLGGSSIDKEHNTKLMNIILS